MILYVLHVLQFSIVSYAWHSLRVPLVSVQVNIMKMMENVFHVIMPVQHVVLQLIVMIVQLMMTRETLQLAHVFVDKGSMMMEKVLFVLLVVLNVKPVQKLRLSVLRVILMNISSYLGQLAYVKILTISCRQIQRPLVKNVMKPVLPVS